MLLLTKLRKYFLLAAAVLTFIDFIKRRVKHSKKLETILLIFLFQLVARKLLEILDKIVALKVGCVNQKSYLEILKHINRSSILCSHPARKR